MSANELASASNVPDTLPQILTIDDLAAYLRCSRRSIYNLTRKRSQEGANPAPVLRLPMGMRFRRVDIDAWLSRCGQAVN